jgi:tripartite-type tricarboxylate transporter receptor subunit TctC
MKELRRAATAIFALLVGSALAQTPAGPIYPAKPVRLLVGFAPGGGIDIDSRIHAQRLTDSLGQSFARRFHHVGRPGWTLANSVVTALPISTPPA